MVATKNSSKKKLPLPLIGGGVVVLGLVAFASTAATSPSAAATKD